MKQTISVAQGKGLNALVGLKLAGDITGWVHVRVCAMTVITFNNKLK